MFDSDDCKDVKQLDRNLTVFQEEYNYYRKLGHSHSVATNYAIDYYRKHTKHEITENWVKQADESTSVEDDTIETIQFNEVVRSIFKELKENYNDSYVKLFSLIIVQQDLDENLDQDLQDLVYSYTKESRPELNKDLIDCMGMKPSKIGISVPLYNMRMKIKELCSSLNFKPA